VINVPEGVPGYYSGHVIGTRSVPFKKPKGAELTVDEQTYNAVHGALRCLGERANSLLTTTYKALRRYRGDPWRLGTIVAAALVLLHHENHRTT
jgi:DDE superfamily endonuclease